MSTFFRSSLLILLVTLLSVSCVSKKKYKELENLKNKVQKILDDKNQSLKANKATQDSLNAMIADLEKRLNDCDKKVNKLRQDSTQMASGQNSLQEDLTELRASCEQAKENYEKLKNKSADKIRSLIANLEALQEDLRKREARLREVEGQLARRDSIVNALYSKLNDALIGFKDKGLTVEIRNGKVYVSLSNKLLFKSGSTKIDPEGQKALKDLSTVLRSSTDITIMVEGHTDDVPVSNLGDIKDNWDLSVMRSTEVVRLLVKEGVDPLQVIPSGRGEFIPVDPNKTNEARAKNRRTEIVLSPKLDELYKLVEESR